MKLWKYQVFAFLKLGYRAELLYYIALCHYVKKQFVNSLKALSEIIERGIKNYPELNVGTGADDLELRKISNSQVNFVIIKGPSWKLFVRGF